MSKPRILRTSPTSVVASNAYLKEMKKAPYPVASATQRSKIHYRCEADRIETGFAYQESVDFRLRHKTLRVARLDAAAVKDADAIRRFCSKTVLRLSADEPVSIAGRLWRGGLAGADRPDGLIGDYDSRELPIRKRPNTVPNCSISTASAFPFLRSPCRRSG